jgi:glutathione S-transferase
MLIVHGANASPFVRKVRALLVEKGVVHENKLVFLGDQTPEWKKMSPLGKMPVLQDGDYTVPDSSVICLYLEKKHPDPALYPQAPADYGRALWLEEWADSTLAPVAGGKVFFPRIVGPRFLNQPTDEAAVERTLREELPPLLDYLESELPGTYFVGGRFSIADIAVATHFVNLAHAQVTVDGGRWPKLAAHVRAVLSRPSFESLVAEERALFG